MSARLLPWGIALLIAVASSSCANYRDDLDRAADHYNNRRYEEAVALLEVLEPDVDSLSKAERVRYAYYRGMSYYLVESKLHARHWLGRAMARLEDNEDALRPDELKQAQDTIGELNAAVYGGAETPSSKGDDAAKKCKVDGDCDEGAFCDAGTCRAPDEDASKSDGSSEGDAAPAASAAPSAEPAPSAPAPAP